MKKANFHTSFTARKSAPNGKLYKIKVLQNSAQYKTPSFISCPRIQAALKIAKKKIKAAAFISDFTVVRSWKAWQKGKGIVWNSELETLLFHKVWSKIYLMRSEKCFQFAGWDDIAIYSNTCAFVLLAYLRI